MLLFSAMQRDGKSCGVHVDQQTQTPGAGVSVVLRDQLRNASRNIKNRWSSSGADGAGGVIGPTDIEEAQSLLGGAADQPHDTPAHAVRPTSQHDLMNRNINHPDPPPYHAPATATPPSLSQLQRAINHTLRSSGESKTLSTQDPLSSSVKDRAETIC
jgi:hypothetical protein